MDAGDLVVRELACGAEIPLSGDGRSGADVLLANSRFHAVIRSPEQAMTLLRAGGGTLLDASPWEADDPLIEIVPIVGGGWLDVDTFDVTDDGIRVGGTVVDLPDRPAEDAGERREITWRIAPDDPWLYVDGADGLWVHPRPSAGVYDGATLQTSTSLQAGAGDVEDLGGALRIDGADRWLVGGPADWAELGPTQALAGTLLADGIPTDGSVRLLAAGVTVGRHYVDELGAFDLQIPATVDAVIGEVGGFVDTAPVTPGDALVLDAEPAGILRILPVWDGIDPRELPVSFASNGASRRLLVGPDGRDIAVGPGAWDVTFGDVPSLAAATARVDVVAGDVVDVPLRPTRAWEPGERVLAAFGALGEGSWRWRASDAFALSTAAADGFGFVVVAPPDGVGLVSDADDALRLGWRDGTLAVHPDGWSILAWPWTANDKFAAFGAPDLAGMDPATALSVATGPSSGRFTAVDLAWMDVAGPAFDHRFPPAFVRLEDPGPAGPAAWAAWWAWLDAGRSVAPLGPATWVAVADAGLYGAGEVESGMLNGRVSAGSGPVVSVAWGADAPPRVELHGRGTADRLAIVSSGGVILAQWTVTGDATYSPLLLDAGAWVVAVAWTSAGGDWAVSGPVWLAPPGQD